MGAILTGKGTINAIPQITQVFDGVLSDTDDIGNGRAAYLFKLKDKTNSGDVAIIPFGQTTSVVLPAATVDQDNILVKRVLSTGTTILATDFYLAL
jgi:hypothetical protein